MILDFIYLFGNFTAWQVQFLFTFIIIVYISFKNTHNLYTYIELAHVCSTNEVNKDLFIFGLTILQREFT